MLIYLYKNYQGNGLVDDTMAVPLLVMVNAFVLLSIMVLLWQVNMLVPDEIAALGLPYVFAL